MEGGRERGGGGGERGREGRESGRERERRRVKGGERGERGMERGGRGGVLHVRHFLTPKITRTIHDMKQIEIGCATYCVEYTRVIYTQYIPPYRVVYIVMYSRSDDSLTLVPGKYSPSVRS